jgi:hypothetical protein
MGNDWSMLSLGQISSGVLLHRVIIFNNNALNTSK